MIKLPIEPVSASMLWSPSADGQPVDRSDTGQYPCRVLTMRMTIVSKTLVGALSLDAVRIGKAGS